MAVVAGAEKGHAQAVQEALEPFRRANIVLLCPPTPVAEVLRVLGANLRQRGFALDSVNHQGGVVGD